jgi:hypothetical protein
MKSLISLLGFLLLSGTVRSEEMPNFSDLPSDFIFDRVFERIYDPDTEQLDLLNRIDALDNATGNGRLFVIDEVLKKVEASPDQPLAPSAFSFLIARLHPKDTVDYVWPRIRALMKTHTTEFWERELFNVLLHNLRVVEILQEMPALKNGLKLKPKRLKLVMNRAGRIFYLDEERIRVTGHLGFLDRSEPVQKPEIWSEMVDRQSLKSVQQFKLTRAPVSIRPNGDLAIWLGIDGDAEIIDLDAMEVSEFEEKIFFSVDKFFHPQRFGVFWVADSQVLVVTEIDDVGRLLKLDLKSRSVERLALPESIQNDEDSLLLWSKGSQLVSAEGSELIEILPGEQVEGRKFKYRINRYDAVDLELISSTETPNVVGSFNVFGLIPESSWAFGSGRELCVFDLQSGELVMQRSFQCDQYWSPVKAVSDDGRWIVILGDGSSLKLGQSSIVIRIVDVRTGRTILAFHPSEFTSEEISLDVDYHSDIQFSPSSDELAISHDDGSISLWTLPDLEALAAEPVEPLPTFD